MHTDHKKILITGSNGYIAKEIYTSLNKKYDITLINRNTFDLRDNLSTKEWFSNRYFDVVIHTAITGGSRLLKDNSTVLDDNIRMYFNLLDCSKSFTKFLNIGSGAEKYYSNTYYGSSKKIINESIKDKNNFYNLRIYAVFNENELNTRFIKSNIIRYLNNNSLMIYKNRYMDFIYMNDFIAFIENYIIYENLPKTIDCVYSEKTTLADIASKINSLNDNKVNIIEENKENDVPYTGDYYDLGIKLFGLDNGIRKTYLKLRENYEKNMVCS